MVKNPALAASYRAVLDDLRKELGGESSPVNAQVIWTALMLGLMEHSYLTGKGLASIWGPVNRGDLDGALRAISEYNSRAEQSGRLTIKW